MLKTFVKGTRYDSLTAVLSKPQISSQNRARKSIKQCQKLLNQIIRGCILSENDISKDAQKYFCIIKDEQVFTDCKELDNQTNNGIKAINNKILQSSQMANQQIYLCYNYNARFNYEKSRLSQNDVEIRDKADQNNLMKFNGCKEMPKVQESDSYFQNSIHFYQYQTWKS